MKFDERYSGMGNRWKLCSANGTVRGHFDGKNSHIKRKGGVQKSKENLSTFKAIQLLSKPAVALSKQK